MGGEGVDAMSSDIPQARSILRAVLGKLAEGDIDVEGDISEALELMTRTFSGREVCKREKFDPTPAQIAQIDNLLANSDLSLADICIQVGLPAKMAGRISEHQNGLR